MVRALLFLLALISPTLAGLLRDLPYAGPESAPLQKLDLYRDDDNAEGAVPVVMLIHGGDWTKGDKADESLVVPKVAWLLEQGFVVVSVNYQLVPEVKHSAQVEDICRAIAWVQKHAARYGGDPDRIWLLGHSAGAQLAALAAVEGDRLMAAGVKRQALRGVVLLEGAGYDVPRQTASLRKKSPMKAVYRKVFTEDPAVQRDASPVYKISARPPPLLILHRAERKTSADQAAALSQALQAREGKAQVIAVAGKSHASMNADCGKPGDPVTAAVAGFLKH
jgi:acetyl esterase/lipase